MRGRGLLIASILLAGLAIGLYFSNRQKAAEAAKPPVDTAAKILSLSEADIRKIDLKKKGGAEVALEKKDGKWQMTAPQPERVDQDAASQLVSAAATLASDKVIDNPDKPSAYGLDPPAQVVEITEKSGKTHNLLIGDDTPTNSGTYAKLASDPRIYTIASYTKTNLDKSDKDLRDKRLLTFDQDKVSRVELVAKNQDIEFGRSKDEWQILKPKPLRADGLQVEELVRKLKDAKMDAATSDDDAKKAATNFATGTPVATVKITDPSGTQDLQIRKKDADYYAKSSVTEGVQKVASDLGQGVDKSVDDFRNKKLLDFGFNEPSRIDMHDNGKTYSFQKSGENWTSNGKKMDSTSVQNFLDKLRDFAASKFVDTGFSSPSIDVSVTSSDGKRVEKVLVAKQGGNYIAQRENEPSLYQLESKSVDDLERAAGDVKPAQAAKK